MCNQCHQVMWAAYMLTSAWHHVSTLGAPLLSGYGSRDALPQKAKWVYVTMVRRWLANRHATFLSIPSGGHHPHLTQAHHVAKRLAPWLARSVPPGAEGAGRRL